MCDRYITKFSHNFKFRKSHDFSFLGPSWLGEDLAWGLVGLRLGDDLVWGRVALGPCWFGTEFVGDELVWGRVGLGTTWPESGLGLGLTSNG